MNPNVDRSPAQHILSIDDRAVGEAWMQLILPHVQHAISAAITDAMDKHARRFLALLEPRMADSMLSALRQHSKETAVEVTCDATKIDRTMEYPSKDEMLSLIGEFDGRKWAEMFVRCDPPKDLDTMTGWFANAIMAGYDHKAKEQRKNPEVPGEREVWAQAFNATYAFTYMSGDNVDNSLEACNGSAAKAADHAVKLFRERYK